MNPVMFMERSLEGLKRRTRTHRDRWGLGTERDWTVDQNAGTVSFAFPDGRVARAPVQIVGTLDENGRFQWSWAMPSVHEGVRQHALALRRFGAEHGLLSLTSTHTTASLYDAWGWTAAAVHLCDASGAYCAKTGSQRVFMTFGRVEIVEEQEVTRQEPAVRLARNQAANASIDVDRADGALALVRIYCQGTYYADLAYRRAVGTGQDDAHRQTAITAKTLLYARTWRDDHLWRPTTVAWPSPHDTAKARDWRVKQSPRGHYVTFAAPHDGTLRRHRYEVRKFDEGLRIIGYRWT